MSAQGGRYKYMRAAVLLFSHAFPLHRPLSVSRFANLSLWQLSLAFQTLILVLLLII
jgi:hypothetical protein